MVKLTDEKRGERKKGKKRERETERDIEIDMKGRFYDKHYALNFFCCNAPVINCSVATLSL